MTFLTRSSASICTTATAASARSARASVWRSSRSCWRRWAARCRRPAWPPEARSSRCDCPAWRRRRGRGRDGSRRRRWRVVSGAGRPPAPQPLRRHAPLREMGADLALDALKGVVDRLRVAADTAADLLVGVAVEVQREDAGLELGERRRDAGHQRPELLGGDRLIDRVVHGGPGQYLVERRLVVTGPAGGRARERDVLVQRRVLVPGRRLDRGDDLARDAELGEVAEARLAIGAVVAHRLVEADQALLDQIIGVAAGQEVRRGLEADESVIPADQPIVGVWTPLLGQGDQETILNLRLSLRRSGKSGHEKLSPLGFAAQRRG